ncbi:uncharacterized protein J3R85_000211 [Psidium guajava]|nr:uncharacterized protein J3R85_000211 [Psidium guajava]
MDERLSQKFSKFDENLKHLLVYIIELGVESASLPSLRRLVSGLAMLSLSTSCRSSRAEEERGSERRKVTSGGGGAGVGIGGVVKETWEEL